MIATPTILPLPDSRHQLASLVNADIRVHPLGQAACLLQCSSKSFALDHQGSSYDFDAIGVFGVFRHGLDRRHTRPAVSSTNPHPTITIAWTPIGD